MKWILLIIAAVIVITVFVLGWLWYKYEIIDYVDCEREEWLDDTTSFY